MTANSPWSGYYEVNNPIWVTGKKRSLSDQGSYGSWNPGKVMDFYFVK